MVTPAFYEAKIFVGGGSTLPCSALLLSVKLKLGPNKKWGDPAPIGIDVDFFKSPERFCSLQMLTFKAKEANVRK